MLFLCGCCCWPPFSVRQVTVTALPQGELTSYVESAMASRVMNVQSNVYYWRWIELPDTTNDDGSKQAPLCDWYVPVDFGDENTEPTSPLLLNTIGIYLKS